MDWQSLLTIGGIVIFIFLMMRGCGGMMSGGCGMGGCGMGSRRRQEPEEHDPKNSLPPAGTKR